jgi:hypothetical protein
MKDQATDTKNIVDSAHPASPEVKRLSEAEKKAMELGGRMEHADGEAREELHDEAEKLGRRTSR